MAGIGSGPFSKWCLSFTHQPNQMKALTIHVFDSRNTVPYSEYEARWSCLQDPNSNPLMAPFFKCISLFRELNNRCSNCIYYKIGGSCSFNDPELYTKFGFGY
jgi:hypothetical protein